MPFSSDGSSGNPRKHNTGDKVSEETHYPVWLGNPVAFSKVFLTCKPSAKTRQYTCKRFTNRSSKRLPMTLESSKLRTSGYSNTAGDIQT